MKPAYAPSRGLRAKIGRRLTQWRAAAPDFIAPERPLVSFTFDDFPMSALHGADILERHGVRGTFYAATARLGAKVKPMGDMADAATIADLQARGHEIGAHTHTHGDCAAMPVGRFHADVAENLVQLADIGGERHVSSFAYPYGETRAAIKREAADIFATARGVLPGVNVGWIDRAQLRAVELGETPSRRLRAYAMLKHAIRLKAWVIFFTHDVREQPSDFGVLPRHLEDLIRFALDNGAVVDTVEGAATRTGIIQPQPATEVSPPAALLAAE